VDLLVFLCISFIDYGFLPFGASLLKRSPGSPVSKCQVLIHGAPVAFQLPGGNTTSLFFGFYPWVSLGFPFDSECRGLIVLLYFARQLHGLRLFSSSLCC